MQKYCTGLVKTIPSCKRCACVRWFTLTLPLLLLLLGFLNAALDVLQDVHQLLRVLQNKHNTAVLVSRSTLPPVIINDPVTATTVSPLAAPRLEVKLEP